MLFNSVPDEFGADSAVPELVKGALLVGVVEVVSPIWQQWVC